MNKVAKVLILVCSLGVILYFGLNVWLNYKDRKEALPIVLKSEVNFIVTKINNYCAVEEMKLQMGQITSSNCSDNKIMNNISNIVDINEYLFEEILDLDFDGQVKKIELKYKNKKYVYREDNSEIIITDLNDYSYENNDSNNNQENDNSGNVQQQDPNKSEAVEDVIINDEFVKSLYNKYISYAKYETNNYKNINVNDSSSDEYLVKYSIYKILEDNNVNIKDYNYDSSDIDMGGFKYGYKIPTSLIKSYIKTNFNVQRTINFNDLYLQFVINGSDSDIAYYYNEEERAYSLISDSSIPKTGTGDIIKYSKYNKHEVIGDELIIYTDFFLIGNDMGIAYINNNMDTVRAVITTLGDMGEIDVDYILNNHNDKIGKFKHTFKKVEGNYIWVSTTQTN